MVSESVAIVEDPDVMGGIPVFQGTRVSIANVLASHRAGFNLDQLREAYPFLTQEFVDAAVSYVPSHRTALPKKPAANASRVPISSERVPLRPGLSSNNTEPGG